MNHMSQTGQHPSFASTSGSPSYNNANSFSYGSEGSMSEWQGPPNLGPRQHSTNQIYNASQLSNFAQRDDQAGPHAFAVGEGQSNWAVPSPEWTGWDYNTGYEPGTTSPALLAYKQSPPQQQNVARSVRQQQQQQQQRPSQQYVQPMAPHSHQPMQYQHQPQSQTQQGLPVRPLPPFPLRTSNRLRTPVRDPSSIYNSITQPYPYTTAFHKLTAVLQRRFSPQKTLRIAQVSTLFIRIAMHDMLRTNADDESRP